MDCALCGFGVRSAESRVIHVPGLEMLTGERPLLLFVIIFGSHQADVMPEGFAGWLLTSLLPAILKSSGLMALARQAAAGSGCRHVCSVLG